MTFSSCSQRGAFVWTETCGQEEAVSSRYRERLDEYDWQAVYDQEYEGCEIDHPTDRSQHSVGQSQMKERRYDASR